jgi:hypothetical protein
MPIDDLRSRKPARPVPDEAEDDLGDPEPWRGEPNPTPQRLAEIEAAQLAEAVRRLKAYDEGREAAFVWDDELEESIFGPPTPEELAEEARERARR